VTLPKKVLLTGATGFLGSHLAGVLVERGLNVIALKRKTSNLARLSPVLSKVEVLDADRLFNEPSLLAESPVNAIFHTATCYGRHQENTDEIFEANCGFPMKLLQAAASLGVKTFYNIDTILPANLNDYTRSKHQFIEQAKEFSANSGIRLVNIKMEHIYGPGDDQSKFIDFVIRQCLANVPELKLTLGIQKREFIYIDDATDALIKIMECAEKLPGDYFEIEMVSDEPTPTIREVVELVLKVTQSSTKPLFGAIPYRPHEEMERIIDAGPLKTLGWKKRVSLEAGLLAVVASMKNNSENKELHS
jgi:CDP-paratose synthetase